jgi:glycogen(starch) synthase
MAVERAARVLVTADTVGGVWTYAADLARELAARGIQVALATLGAPLSPHQRQQVAGDARITLFESHWRLEWMQDCWDDVDAAGHWLLELERSFTPDLVHLNQFSFGALPFRAPKLVVAHSCVLSWWRAVHGEPAPPAWDRYRDRVRQGLAGAGLVAAPTQAMLASLAQDYGHAGSGIVIPNGARAADFPPGPKQPCVLAAGRFWDAAKNLSALERVAPGLPWPVKVAGATAHPDGGTRTPSSVQCLGELPREALAREFARASIYTLPARYEPFGLSVLEAALAGCALVLGDIASLREVWADAAVYVPPEDHQALRRALSRLIAQPEERSRYAQAARQRALWFTSARSCEGCLAAYGRLAPRFTALAAEEPACA